MSKLLEKIKIVLNHVKSGDVGYIFKSVRKRLSFVEKSFGLKRDLIIPFTNPKARIELSVRLFEERDFEQFKMTHSEDGLIMQNIPNCYVAVSNEDVPFYRQWLIGSEHNNKLQNYYGDMLPNLKKGEALLEGAFTPPASRGMRIMPAAMAIIAEKAKDLNARYVITFVVIDNIPSLKGCKRSGFHPYLLRTEKWFLFKRSIIYSDIPEEFMAQYLIDTAEKQKK